MRCSQAKSVIEPMSITIMNIVVFFLNKGFITVFLWATEIKKKKTFHRPFVNNNITIHKCSYNKNVLLSTRSISTFYTLHVDHIFKQIYVYTNKKLHILYIYTFYCRPRPHTALYSYVPYTFTHSFFFLNLTLALI